MSQKNYKSLTEAAKYADVSPRTLRRWIAENRLTAYRAGPRLIKVDLQEIDRMLSPIPTAGTVAHAG